jgi:cyclohexyl-isocyanide hydratase
MTELPHASIAFLLYPKVTRLDFTGPAQFVSRFGNAKPDFVWKKREPVATDAGFKVLPTATFREITPPTSPVSPAASAAST